MEFDGEQRWISHSIFFAKYLFQYIINGMKPQESVERTVRQRK